jgi:flagellum-specific ATP synthase
MQPLPSELQDALSGAVQYPEIGLVQQVIGLMIESFGPPAQMGDLCWIETADPHTPRLMAEVVGFRDQRVLLMPLGDVAPLAPGQRVINSGGPLSVSVGPELLGRILDGLGQPLDGRFELSKGRWFHTHAHAPHPLQRQDIDVPLVMGIRAIDGFLTIGQGQRVGIFAGSGVGKSTLLGMLARNTQADISVIALIGERGREVRDFIDNALGPEALKRSVVVVATSEQPALVKVKAALVATTIAEYFRKHGNNVLLMMDSLTRVAMALREVGLATGEPPATRGYTPSVFAFMPRLLERSGTAERGAITGLYTVLVEGDDMNEPVADMVRGLLDGHIVLTRELAEQFHFPAIDVLGSVSRLFLPLATPAHRQAVASLRDMLAIYKRSEDLISIGAYVPGQNPKLDRAVRLKPALDAFLRQDVEESSTWEDTQQRLLQLATQ